MTNRNVVIGSVVLALVFLLSIFFYFRKEDLKKAARFDSLTFNLSSVASSAPQRVEGIAGQDGRVSVSEVFQGEGEGVSVPLAAVKIPEGTKYEVTVPERIYSVNTEVKVEGKEVTANSEIKITVNDKSYTVPVKTTVSKVEVKPTSKWKLEPSLFLGFGSSFSLSELGSVDVVPTVSASFLSYGPPTEPSRLSLLGLGVGYGLASREVQFVVHPILLNINPVVPFLKNTYISPTVSIYLNKNVSVGIGLAVAL
jgi:predicted DNA-binding antitoxin AbrB/MazE fold protein